MAALSIRMSVPAIAGWLFADLLLAFSIIVLGTQDPPSAPAVPPPVPTRQALERVWITIDLSVDPQAAERGADSAVGAVRKALRTKPRLVGRKAGIVLTFGAEHDGGQRFAHHVNALLERADPALFGDVRTRDLQLLNTGGGKVQLQIYLFHNE